MTPEKRATLEALIATRQALYDGNLAEAEAARRAALVAQTAAQAAASAAVAAQAAADAEAPLLEFLKGLLADTPAPIPNVSAS